ETRKTDRANGKGGKTAERKDRSVPDGADRRPTSGSVAPSAAASAGRSERSNGSGGSGSPMSQGSTQDDAETGLISIEDLARTKLRTARVLAAERVEGSSKLLRLDVEMGEEDRTVVAGIAESYTPEELVGKQVVVVANLQPARIRGVVSQGMLLAAS